MRNQIRSTALNRAWKCAVAALVVVSWIIPRVGLAESVGGNALQKSIEFEGTAKFPSLPELLSLISKQTGLMIALEWTSKASNALLMTSERQVKALLDAVGRVTGTVWSLEGSRIIFGLPEQPPEPNLLKEAGNVGFDQMFQALAAYDNLREEQKKELKESGYISFAELTQDQRETLLKLPGHIGSTEKERKQFTTLPPEDLYLVVDFVMRCDLRLPFKRSPYVLWLTRRGPAWELLGKGGVIPEVTRKERGELGN